MGISHIEIEKFIGRNIDDIPFESELLSSSENRVRIFSISGFDGERYFNKPLSHLIAYTNEKGFIEKVFADFKGSFDVQFYDSIVNRYGLPTSILRKEKEQHIKSEEFEGIISSETKGVLVKCDFTDNPHFIIWDSPQLKMTFTIIRELEKIELVIGKSFFSKD